MQNVNFKAIPKSGIDLSEGCINIRRAFVARPGYSLVAADYEQEICCLILQRCQFFNF